VQCQYYYYYFVQRLMDCTASYLYEQIKGQEHHMSCGRMDIKTGSSERHYRDKDIMCHGKEEISKYEVLRN
jgi:hypothetical protein